MASWRLESSTPISEPQISHELQDLFTYTQFSPLVGLSFLLKNDVVHHSNNISQWPTWCTNSFNIFITILYMFRPISCSSSGGQIALIQHLVSSLSVSDRPVHRFFLNLCTGRSLTESDDTRCCINTTWPPEDEQDIARNMHRIVINIFKNLCIKLVIG